MSELRNYRVGNDTCPHCLAAHPTTWDCRQSPIEPTRPQPSAEPVAWLYELPNGEESLLRKQNSWGHPDYEGWTETPLYPASALEAARREGWEFARSVLQQIHDGEATDQDIAQWLEDATKENTNAG